MFLVVSTFTEHSESDEDDSVILVEQSDPLYDESDDDDDEYIVKSVSDEDESVTLFVSVLITFGVLLLGVLVWVNLFGLKTVL